MDFQPWLAGKSQHWAEVLVVNSGIVQQTMFYKGILEPQEKKTREHMCFFSRCVFLQLFLFNHLDDQLVACIKYQVMW